MKKHVIASAVAALIAVPAMAQNVTIGGILDVAPHSARKSTLGTTTSDVKGTGNYAGSFGSAASNRINITFGEDLGGGLKVDGLYRLRFTTTGGTGGDDDMWLRLSTNVGSFKLGRFSGMVDNLSGATGAFAAANTTGGIAANASDLVSGTLSGQATAIVAATGAVTKAAAGVGAFDDTRGLLQYVSPTFSGITATIDYANNTSDESTTAGKGQTKQQGLGLNYKAGALEANFSSTNREISGVLGTTEATTASKGKILWASVSYDMGPVKVFLANANRKDKTVAGATSDDVSVNSLGIQVPMGPWTFFATAYDGEDKNTGVAGAVGTEKRDLSGNQVAARYALSKRTYAYLVRGVAQDKGLVANGNYKRTETALGLAHSF
jgi:hypothetical protein